MDKASGLSSVTTLSDELTSTILVKYAYSYSLLVLACW